MNPTTTSFNFFPTLSAPHVGPPQFPANGLFNMGELTTVATSTQHANQMKRFYQEPVDKEIVTKEGEGSKQDSPPKQNSKRKGHDCSVCGKNFRQKPVLKTHMKIHSGEKDHICSECGKSFTYKANMDVHMRTHTGEKPHVCHHCGKGFSQANSLKYHLSTHTGVKPFSCPVCLKAFVTKANLRDHMITHSSEKPFSCDICGHSFARKVSLKFHLRSHSNYKPFKCKYCDNSYTASSLLIYHNQVHCGPHSRDHLNKLISGNKVENSDARNQNYESIGHQFTGEKSQKDSHREMETCLVCGKSFGSKFLYLDHRGGCVPEKKTNKKCPECHIICKDHESLTRHLNQHQAEKLKAEQFHHDNLRQIMGGNSSQNCSYCGAVFLDKDKLIVHYQQHLQTLVKH